MSVEAVEERATRARTSRGERIFDIVIALLIAVVIVAPLTRRGWLLLLDWAPGPRGGVGRGLTALPSGPLFVIPTRAAHAVFGAAVGWLPIAVPIVVAAVGAAVLVDGPRAARVAAAVAFAFNPWVYDRIYAGQLSVLFGYAVLPWLARAVLRADSPRRGVLAGLWWAAASACSVHFAWIGAVVIVAGAIARARDGTRRVLVPLGVAVAVGVVLLAAWTIPSRDTAPDQGDQRVLRSFATRADPDLGRTIGILAEQGFWRAASTEPRDDLGALFPLVAGVVIAGAIAGLVFGARDERARLVATVAIAGGAGWLLAHGSAGPIGSLYRWAWRDLPGFAVMREAQKWSALVCLAVATGLALLARALARARLTALAWIVVIVPVALAPTLAWGLWNRVEPSRYPSAWAGAREQVDAVDAPIVAVPYGRYLDPGFTDERVVANPAPSYFGRTVIVSRDAELDGLAADEGLRADVRAALDDARAAVARGDVPELGRDLARLGVGGALVLDADPSLSLDGDPRLDRVRAGNGVTLWVVK